MTGQDRPRDLEYYSHLMEKDPDTLTEKEWEEVRAFLTTENDVHEETVFELMIQRILKTPSESDLKSLAETRLAELLLERIADNPAADTSPDDCLTLIIQDYVESHPDSPSNLKDWLTTVLRDAPKPDLVLFLNDHRKQNLTIPSGGREIAPEIEEPGAYSLKSTEGKVIWSAFIPQAALTLTAEEESQLKSYDLAAADAETEQASFNYSQDTTTDNQYQVTVLRKQGSAQLIINRQK